MTMADNIPQIIVTVDFGTSSTGVSWGYAVQPKDQNFTVHQISDWPSSDDEVYKNDTSLLYQNQRVIQWGALIKTEDLFQNTTTYQTHFKRFLDPQFLKNAQYRCRRDNLVNLPANDSAVDTLFQDYLFLVHSHLEQRWRKKRVDFIFSIPTTWNDQPYVVQRFKSLFREAGFGTKGDGKHRAFIGDTEAVAAGVYTLSTQKPQEYAVGDIILVCDAGGGTTDLALLKVTWADRRLPSFDILHAPAGCNVGSCNIDEAVSNMLVDRVARVEGDMISETSSTIHAFIRGPFQLIKCRFGCDDLRKHNGRIIGGQDLELDEKAGRSHFILSNAELQDVFDTQVTKILRSIDSMFAYTESHYPSKQISHLVLCGGLGSSRHVQRRLLEHLNQSPQKHPCTAGLRLKTFETQASRAAVSQGLAYMEIQNLARGAIRNEAERLCSPRSYGVEIVEKYDPKLHDKAQVSSSAGSKKPYVRTIRWIIEANQGYPPDGHHEQQLHLKIKDGLIPSLSTKLYASAPTDTANLQSSPGKAGRAYPGRDGVEFLQDLKIDLPLVETHKLSLWSRIRHTAPKLVFRAVAELHGTNLVFKLKYADHESAPSLPIRCDWKEYKGDYLPPFAGAG